MRCPKCKSEKIVKFGVYPSVKLGERQRYRCHKGHTFYANTKRRVKARRSKKGR